MNSRTCYYQMLFFLINMNQIVAISFGSNCKILFKYFCLNSRNHHIRYTRFFCLFHLLLVLIHLIFSIIIRLQYKRWRKEIRCHVFFFTLFWLNLQIKITENYCRFKFFLTNVLVTASWMLTRYLRFIDIIIISLSSQIMLIQ